MTKPKFSSVTPEQISAVMKNLRSRVDPKNCVRSKEHYQWAAWCSWLSRNKNKGTP